ncbi:Proteasome-associated ATPase [Roseovarius albus]|uniref:Proteasome-associated ATPase n=1 Tax=Roseovarius albus TaxID=1247867 RepID=A0A1X6ZSE2_9RHOB|nr:ATP-binding protein [Roseovarius albus]SLN59830.1 Proteasome-associated ATPase [Roseovarius albus]
MTREARIPSAALQARALDLAGERVCWLLAGQTGSPPDLEKGLQTLSAVGAVGLAEVIARFGLSDTELDVFLMAAGPELGPKAAHAVATHPLALEGRVTPALVTQILGPEATITLATNALLSQAALVVVGAGRGLAQRQLSIDPGIAQFLHGHPSPGDALSQALILLARNAIPNQRTELLPLALQTAAQAHDRPLVHLRHSDRYAAEMLAQGAFAQLGLAGFALDRSAVTLPAARLAAEVNRDLILLGGGLMLTTDDAEGLADLVTVPCIIWGDKAPVTRRPLAEFNPEEPDPELAPDLFLSATEVRNARSTFALGLVPNLVATARARAARALDGLAQPISPQAQWEDLILPEAQMAQLRHLAEFQNHRHQVLDSWGFKAKSERGLGLAALFSGPSGTGKTMAAELVATALGQADDHAALYRVDLSAVVSKYIGETEKNIARIFDAAENSSAVLLFDEGEALFGKRTSDVKDSLDRHANTETAYLLQRLEAYTGCAIVTTNLKNTVDDAFLRRFRVVIDFPFPDAAQRERIWRVIFPTAAPLGELDFAALSRLSISGGFIRSIALSAAFLAAAEGTRIEMRHLGKAARAEFGKLGKPLPETQIRGWA